MMNRRMILLLVCVIGLGAAVAGYPLVFAPIAAIAGVVAVWLWPARSLEGGVLLVLTIRPWVDVFSDRRAGLGPFASNPAVLIGLTVLGIAVVQGFRRWRARMPLWPDPGIRSAHVYLVAAYAVAFFSGVRLFGATGLGEGVREAVRVASVLAAFLLVYWWAESSPARWRRGWVYLAIGAAIPIGVAMWQYAAGTGYLETESLNRLQGTLSHPNAFGQYLLPFALLAVNGAVSARGSRRPALLATSIGLIWLVVHSYSRTVLLALAAGVVALVAIRTRRIDARLIVKAMLSIAVLGTLGGLLARDALRQRFANLALGRRALDAAQSGEAENSYEWRLINWGVLISMGFAHPVAGHGAGMTTSLNPIVNTDNGVPYNAHNDFVRFFFEGGFLGLVAYLVYAVWLCRWSIRKARSAEGDDGRGHAVAAAWLALLLLGLGTAEISLATASLYTLYGMLALQALVPTPGPSLAGTGVMAGAEREATEG